MKKKPANKTQIKSWILKNINNQEWKSKYIDNLQKFVDYIKLKEENKNFPYNSWGEKKTFNFSLIELRIMCYNNKSIDDNGVIICKEISIDDIIDIHYLAGTFKVSSTSKTKEQNSFKNWNGDY